MTWILIGWGVGSVLAWAFIHGANRRPTPIHPAALPDEACVSESSGQYQSTNEVWDGADPTGPAPSP